jgi:limonene-1,2-epoxide hydrolase
MSTSDPIDLVTRFCAAWPALDLDAILEFFTDDAVYHNIPMEAATGKAAIRSTIEGFAGGVESVEFRVLHIAAAGDVVLTERIDVFHLAERSAELPVMGTFEVRDGKIAAWRDYFDLNQVMAAMAG